MEDTREYDRPLGEMKQYCGCCRDDMLTWIPLEAVPRDKVHGNTEVGVFGGFWRCFAR